MNEQLRLENVRLVLMRLEETIIFSLIERAQFKHNDVIYKADAFGGVLEGESLVGFLLLECERSQAKVRRFTSPDEHPFHADLPEPILPPLRYEENPLLPNDINFNARVRDVYEKEIVPRVCAGGDDGQYGSSSVCDVSCLQALSRRVHYGKFVAESKFRARPREYGSAIAAGDRDALLGLLSDPVVEKEVLQRVDLKTRTYGRDPVSKESVSRLESQVVVDLYSRWVIPLNKEVQVAYLLSRDTTRTS